jgi:hypothetical protein
MLEEKLAALDILSIQWDIAEVKDLLLVLKHEAGECDVNLLSIIFIIYNFYGL